MSCFWNMSIVVDVIQSLNLPTNLFLSNIESRYPWRQKYPYLSYIYLPHPNWHNVEPRKIYAFTLNMYFKSCIFMVFEHILLFNSAKGLFLVWECKILCKTLILIRSQYAFSSVHKGASYSMPKTLILPMIVNLSDALIIFLQLKLKN